MRIKDIIKFTPKLLVGLGGNYYIVSENKDNICAACIIIGKSPNSVYYNNKYQCYAARLKSLTHKRRAKKLFNDVERSLNKLYGDVA